MEMTKFNYMIEIDILGNAFQENLGDTVLSKTMATPVYHLIYRRKCLNNLSFRQGKCPVTWPPYSSKLSKLAFKYSIYTA